MATSASNIGAVLRNAMEFDKRLNMILKRAGHCSRCASEKSKHYFCGPIWRIFTCLFYTCKRLKQSSQLEITFLSVNHKTTADQRNHDVLCLNNIVTKKCLGGDADDDFAPSNELLLKLEHMMFWGSVQANRGMHDI